MKGNKTSSTTDEQATLEAWTYLGRRSSTHMGLLDAASEPGVSGFIHGCDYTTIHTAAWAARGAVAAKGEKGDGVMCTVGEDSATGEVTARTRESATMKDVNRDITFSPVSESMLPLIVQVHLIVCR